MRYFLKYWMLMLEAIGWERGQNGENDKNWEMVTIVERVFK